MSAEDKLRQFAIGVFQLADDGGEAVDVDYIAIRELALELGLLVEIDEDYGYRPSSILTGEPLLPWNG